MRNLHEKVCQLPDVDLLLEPDDILTKHKAEIVERVLYVMIDIMKGDSEESVQDLLECIAAKILVEYQTKIDPYNNF